MIQCELLILPQKRGQTLALKTLSSCTAIAFMSLGILNSTTHLDEMRQDVELFEALYPVLLALTQLHKLVDDTFVA